MRQNDVPSFSELLTSARHSAIHLEMRDVYAVEQENGEFEAWKAGHRLDVEDRDSWWRPWLDLVQETVQRGVVMRRARIVSEPVTDYIRFEHSSTFTNVAAGELVRWLPRRQTFDLALPGVDFWLIDERIVRFNHFSGDGVDTEPQVSEDPDVIKLCATAFEAVWDRGIPHEQYQI
ncbi:DUF6879 family protein [Streptomyces hiroshimensis]|uniref:DUF6879 domain-containing protein n=1 Tax=Streptomyces hiroshimensis TaxID=66424 RepID=A0ABQ2Y611_9ACTN|nr:DUF6879 family protein [Streptomyces hiroshimensis]GGX63122.1 hypothetical protein GCM10010324_04840 [Streptomyces hiroshimensis]